MKTIDIEVAIMQYYGIRQNIIIPNISWGMFFEKNYLHECDLLILSKSNYATEVEIKISKADLLKDKEKKHGHFHSHIKYLWFAVPEKLKEIALKEIPERAGLFILHKWEDNRITVHIVKKAKAQKNSIKWTDKQRLKLAELGCMRILGLKKKIKT